jgi:NTP pyrophosphatase (non-canonical NTP hydrolase)
MNFTNKGNVTMTPLTFSAFSKANRARCESPQGFNHTLASWSLSDWLTAAVGEFGEAANVAKKLNRVRDGINGNKETEANLRAAFRREIADAFVYLDLIAQSQGFALEDAVREVFDAKSVEIGYPTRLEDSAVTTSKD